MRRTKSAAVPGLALLAVLAWAGPAAADGMFEALTYNVEGLPPLFNPPDRTTLINQIGPKIEARHQAVGNQIVGTQELFHTPFYTSITGAVTHSNISPKINTNPNGIGDGLTHMADFTSGGTTHVPWTDCFGTGGANGSDCDAPKGYSFTRYQLEPGASVDVYNMHMDAGQDTDSIDARNLQFTQLIDAVNTNSPDNAVILMGDMNAKYTRSADTVGSLLTSLGVTDVWVELANSGMVPGFGADIEAGCPPPRGNAMGMDVDASGPTCELVDKMMYRSSALVELTATNYEVLLDFIDGGGVPLSDHLPVTASFSYTVIPEPATALQLLAGLALLGARRRRLSEVR